MSEFCDHKFVHLDTKKYKKDRVFGAPEWRRVDYYFCERCLEKKNTTDYECGWERPEWY